MSETNIHVEINGSPREIPAGMSVDELLLFLKLTTPAVAVELNLELIPKAMRTQTMLAEGDQLEIVSLVGGG